MRSFGKKFILGLSSLRLCFTFSGFSVIAVTSRKRLTSLAGRAALVHGSTNESTRDV